MKYLTSIFNKVLLAYGLCGMGENVCSCCPYVMLKIDNKKKLCMNMVDRDKKIIEDVLKEIDAQEEKEYFQA
ncbi:MAG: hypothetical protein J6T10_28705 [Methanobrevibacter sp.]|nr:hypothetical protein [Methanobrevibacter sp.]